MVYNMTEFFIEQRFKMISSKEEDERKVYCGLMGLA